MKRRSFVGKTLIGGFAALVAPKVLSANENKSFSKIHTPPKGPVSICTWSFTAANAAAAKALESGSDALTAAIKVAEVEELNAQNTTVGLGGAPDRDAVFLAGAFCFSQKSAPFHEKGFCCYICIVKRPFLE